MPELISILQCCKEGDSSALSQLPQGVYTAKIEREISKANCRAFPPELNTISSPYLDGTLDPAEYGGALWELARGCPFKCSYCYESKGEKKIQYFPMERIEKELKLFAEKDVPQVFVLDPTYNANKERALSLLKMMAKITPNKHRWRFHKHRAA